MTPHPALQPHIDRSIEDFDVEETHYKRWSAFDAEHIDIRGAEGNAILSRDAWGGVEAALTIHFHNSAKNCRVFLGRNLRGKLKISVRGADSLIYIGNDCELVNLELRSSQLHDLVVVGNGVTTTAANTWISGNAAGTATPAIIIGDDCMFSYHCVIRNADAHPIYALADDAPLNAPTSGVLLEPHVWIGERAVILKDVTIGACSIVALGAIVTKSVPRFSMVSGVPAKALPKPGVYWARLPSPKSQAAAKKFHEKFAALPPLPGPSA
jgi:acetyltransferase-like isoleucine patch superfamily enzyme